MGMEKAEQRGMFVSKDGFLGLGIRTTKVGDEEKSLGFLE